MSQWLFVIRPARTDMLTAGPSPEEIDVIGQHFAYWQRLTDDGTALVVGRCQMATPDTMGLAIFRAADAEAAAKIAAADPGVVANVFRMELFPYAVALLGDPDPFRPGGA